jgi:hypothetical protein
MASIVDRDAPARDGSQGGGAALLDQFECALREAGLHVGDRHAATADEVIELGSSWAKRLGIPRRRPAWSLIGTMRTAGGEREPSWHQ